MRRFLLTTGLALVPTLAFAKAPCRTIEPELIALLNAPASMSVVVRPETCTILLAFADPSPEAGAAAYAVALEGKAAHGEVSVQGDILTYRRTAPATGDEVLSLKLSRAGGQERSATLVVRVR
jgi:hypothetical protein